MIVTVLMRPGLDKALARRISVWLWQQGVGRKDDYTEFYVFGDHRADD